MLIKVLKNTLASANSLGNSLKEYEAGEIYDIYEELANTFVRESWGEYVKEIEIQTQEENIELETQEENIELETQEENIELETQDLKITKKKNK